MLQTKQYNDFTKYSYSQRKDEDFMFGEMQKFVQAGGNLNLEVLDSKRSIVSFAEFIHQEFDAEFMGRLLQHNLIHSPFKFKFDDDSKSIIEDSKYTLRWMGNNYIKYHKYIIEAFKDIAKETNGKEITTYSHSYHDNHISHEKIYHPFFFMLSHLQESCGHRAELWSAVLDNNQEIHAYMKDFLSDKDVLEEFISSLWTEIRNSDLANVFYKHNIINDYLKDNPSKVHSLISSAISSGDVELFLKLKKDFDIPQIELKRQSHESFLRFARTPEIAKEVIDAGCFTWGSWNGENLDNYVVDYNYSLNEHIDKDTLGYIINRVDKDFALKHHEYLFNTFFRDIPNLEIMKYLIENHHFPVEKYDILNSFHRARGDKLENMKWAINHGADPRNCEKLLSGIIGSRDKKPLGIYKKAGLIDPFSADMTYHFFGHRNVTKMFSDYYDKNLKDLTYLTKQGKPAWWGLRTNPLFKQFKNRIPDFNQTDSQGNGWINEILFNMKSESASVVLGYLKYAKYKLGEDKLVGKTPEGENFMHHLLYKSKDGMHRGLNKELVDFIFDNIDANFEKLMNAKNDLGYYPLTNFFYFYDTKSIESIKDSNKQNDLSAQENLKHIISKMSLDFPFEQIIQDKPVIELIKDLYPAVYDFAMPSYRASKLHKELDDKQSKKLLKI